MFGPGKYAPDPTEGIVDVNELPPPQLVAYDRNHEHTPCHRCGQLASRHPSGQRTVHDLGDLYVGCPIDLLVTYSSHYCSRCRKHCNIDLSDVAPPGSHDTNRVIDLAVRVVVEDSVPYRPASWRLWRDHRVFVPCAPIQNWVEAGGKKAHVHMDGAFLDWALEAFSGYVAVDELYEGPYCVLSAVDNRQYKRMLYEVLDHDPSHDDIETFLWRLKDALDDRELALHGITTDGSSLYPEPIREVFGDVPHQMCTFHVIKELVQGVLSAVAAERKRLATSKPKLKRGRPSSKDKAARRLARKSTSIQEKISDVFQDRFLCVKRRLKPRERKRFLFITRGLPQLRKLREIMDHIYRLFDRRCRTQTAVSTLKKLRQWVTRFTWIGDTLKKVFSPNLEQALTFLDDKLLPATSNAVERGNRRHRKMQKSVYRVRSKVCLEGRIALDMIRESRAEGRDQTTQTLHRARRGYT